MIDPKVLIVSHMYPSSVDPVDGIFIHNEVRALVKAGVPVRVVSPVPLAPMVIRKKPKWRRYSDIRQAGPFDGIPVERVSVLAFPRPFHVIISLTMALSITLLLSKIRDQFPFNLIHSHTLTPDGWACCFAARRFNVPTICTIRGSDLNEYPRRSRFIHHATRYVLRQTDALIATSKALSEEATKFVYPPVYPTVIYKGVDFSIFSKDGDQEEIRTRLGLPIDQILVVFTGRCEKDKGIGELFEGFLGVNKQYPQTRLLIIGNGSYLPYLKQRSIEAGLRDSVYITGRVSQLEVGKYLQASDMFVLPSYAEGMPNALLEAMACGLPCIASSVGGIPEVIEDGVSGILIPARDGSAVEKAINSLLMSPDLASRLGRTAAKIISQRLSWQTNAEQNINIYRGLIHGRTRSRY